MIQKILALYDQAYWYDKTYDTYEDLNNSFFKKMQRLCNDDPKYALWMLRYA